jgi:hypothetical protein
MIAGLRLLAVDATTGSTRQWGNLRWRRFRSQSIWNGIGGIRGRVRRGDIHLFIPYYFDIGAGGSQVTWQISSDLGYQASWDAVSVVYRYLSFVQGGRTTSL